MGGSAEALSALYIMGRQGDQPCHHAWLVCLSEHCYGDRRPLLIVEPKSVFLNVAWVTLTSGR